ncbi:hypothetical protein BGZ99_009023 [Dissophora globulifera]|uniref:Uncharacterized protein n=1 Tax=Dissophora globulifera TaxID=979702 RepID=A0A9P6R5Y5_9FUNG|nr:hypothetical protein BGZ99_009023 [Dissophora globulifera]
MTTRYSSSESDNSEVEGRNHSRSSTSSVEGEIIKGSVHKNTTTLSSSSESAEHTDAASTGFIARVSSLPLIQDSVSTLHSIAKDNKYSRYALDTAGSAVETVNKYTEPYQTRFQPQISKVDQIASKSLDLLENTFPIVTKPTSEIVTQVKKPIVYVEESSKNAYTQIQSTIDARVTAPVKTVTSSLASTAATKRDQLTTAATSTATSIAATVNTHATPLVDGLETIVNRYLPADAEAEAEQPTAQSNQASRVVDITRNVSLRVSRRVSTGVAPLAQSAQDLRRTAESNESVQALNVRLTALVDALRAHAKELQDNVQKVPGEASQRVQTLSGSLLAEIDSLSVYLKEHSPTLPAYVQARLEPLVGFVNDRYETVRVEMSKSDVSPMQKARNILQLTTEETLPILQSAAQEVKESLLQYQITFQDNVHRGLSRVQEVNSSVNDVATRTLQSARVTLVGAK